MFVCHKTHHQGRGKHSGGRRGHGREPMECRHRDGGWGRSGQGGGAPLNQGSQTSAAPLAAVGATCPLCKNHCPLSEPGCSKGQAYAQSYSPKG